jgi:hypothetical protein
MEPAKPDQSETTAPPSERDPFGTRHKLSNLVMVAAGLEDENRNDPQMMVRLLAVRVVGMGTLAICDVLGSLVTEVRQWRDWTVRRPPRQAK